jgi:TolA-binding protein
MNSRNKYVFESFSSSGGTDLAGDIDSYMKAMTDIDEVKNDPSFDSIMSETAGLVNMHYNKVPAKQTVKDLEFIKESLTDPQDKESINKELEILRLEGVSSGVYEETEELVSDFYSRSGREKDSGIIEKKSFIAAGLAAQEEAADYKTTSRTEEKPARKIYLVRYVSLTAAAMIALMLLIGSLTPSSDPGKIYNSFYEPFRTLTGTTRGENNTSIPGKTLYREGNYKAAEEAFSKLSANEKSSGEVLFLLGLSNLETGKYQSAVGNFNAVINESGQFAKDAKWYLALTYLKTGEIGKATELFQSLSKSEGFYMKPSQKILRRIK